MAFWPKAHGLGASCFRSNGWEAGSATLGAARLPQIIPACHPFVYEQTVGALDCQEQALVQLIFGLNDRWRHVCLGRTEKGPSHFQAVYPWWSTLCFRIKGLPFAGLPLEGNTDQPREWRSAENDQQGCAWRELYSCFCLAWGLVRSIKDVRKIASPDLHSYCCIDDSFENLHCSQSPTKSPTG